MDSQLNQYSTLPRTCRKRKRTAPSWQYFTSNEDGLSANCNICLQVVKISGGSTSSLIRHLGSHHKIHVNEKTATTGKNETSFWTYIDQIRKQNHNPYLLLSSAVPTNGHDHTMNSDVMISKLVAEDGLPFLVVATSPTIRHMFEITSGREMPSSHNTIRDIMLRCYADSKVKVIDHLKRLKMEGKKISLTLDEWTSAANKRYLNINVHAGNDFWNLGLARINGSFTSEACLNLLKIKLLEHEVDLDTDVFGLCTDGAAVMKCFGRLSKRKHQLCMVHGIHLAVVEVLYTNQEQVQCGHQNVADDEDDEDVDAETFEAPFVLEENEEVEFQENIAELISKVRKVVRMFRKSPLKTEILNRHSTSGVSLILDTKTRWNTLVNMLERMFLLKEAVQKAMIDLREPATLTDRDFSVLEDIIQCLKPVKLAVEALCRRDSNLVSADVSLNFMMLKLAAGTSELSKRLFAELKIRILERRTGLSDLANYLHFGSIKEQPGHTLGYFHKFTRKDLPTIIKGVIEMFEQNLILNDSEIMMSEDEPINSESLIVNVSLESELSHALIEAMTFKAGDRRNGTTGSENTTLAEIKKEMHTFLTTGNRGKLLQGVFDHIMTLPPSSVESERAFSSANGFCRKIRTRLSDRSLNALVFLKAYFLKYPTP